MTGGWCSHEELGSFIIDLPSGKGLNDTSIWSKRVIFTGHPSTNVDLHDAPSRAATKRSSPANRGPGDNLNGGPTTGDSDSATPWKRRPAAVAQTNEYVTGDEIDIILHERADAPNTASTVTSSSATKYILNYAEPIIYPVPKTGYYCVAIIPLTVSDQTGKRLSERASTDVPAHPTYAGTILFRNVFNGQLPAAEYPKVNFYLGLTLAYVVFAAAWGYLCFRHMSDLLPIQYYVSMLAGFLVIEMLANWGEWLSMTLCVPTLIGRLGYYRYINAHGTGVSTTAFLVVATILDAGRNALSFFLLLVVSLGLSVVRESLGPVMNRARILTGLHFSFGGVFLSFNPRVD